jgi:tetratricopeptide (TPR) repeat protein
MRLISLSLALSLLAPPVLAQGGKKGGSSEIKVSDEAKAQAKEHYKTAETHYRLREFDQAVVSLKESYRLYPNPLLLFNIAQCYKELKDYEAAISFYENYLDKMPKADNRAEVEKYLKEVKTAKKAEDEQKRKEEEAKLAEAERLKAMAAPTPQPVDGPEGEKPIFKKWWFWSAVGGFAAAGTGAGVVIRANAVPKTDLGNIDILDQ